MFSLAELHLTIQASFNWWNCHLHEFQIGGLRFGDIELLTDGSFADEPRVFDFREVLLRDFDPSAVFRYVYDFGDNWRHTIAIEKLVALEKRPKRATCIGGERARPPEDVGGTSGYERFLEIMSDKSHPEFAETVRWCGGHFDAEWFDLAVVNKDLLSALRPNARRRLHQQKPKLA